MPFLPFQHYRWTHEHTARAEALLLKELFPGDELAYAEDKGSSAYEVFNVALQDGSQSHISTLRIPARHARCESTDEKSAQPPLLLLHGFGTGKAIWAPILTHLATLSKEQNRVVYAIDLPGMGCSSEFASVHKRDLRDVRAGNDERIGKSHPDYAERLSRMAVRYYVDAIHAWTVKMGLDRMVVMGHSFGEPLQYFLRHKTMKLMTHRPIGATIAAAFVHAHPDQVQKLVMVSPVGLESQLSPSQTGETVSTKSVRTYTTTEKIIEYFWTKHHLTPLSIARLAGPLLPYAVRAFVHTSEMYRWARGDKKLRKYAWMYAYAMIRHRSSAETLMPCFISESTYPQQAGYTVSPD